jgi:hypothetical protein
MHHTTVVADKFGRRTTQQARGQTTQHSTIDRSVGGVMTLANAAAMVAAEARARAWWRQHWRQLWRQQWAVGHHAFVVVDGGGKDVIAAAAINRCCSQQ